MSSASASAPVAPATNAASDDAALKNINYKNMLLTGNYGMLKPDIVTNPNIDDILEKEKNANKSDPGINWINPPRLVNFVNSPHNTGRRKTIPNKKSSPFTSFLFPR